MEFSGGRLDVVDPEVRAYVASLVTALGGSGADEDGRYILGDDALACLRDLKRWLKLYDEKANRLDVARCLAESNLVGGDLLQILASWRENEPESRIKQKLSLSCLELLVPLTWPLDKQRDQMTVNHHRHVPFLEMTQLMYKKMIINFDGARILHTAIRTAIPSMSVEIKDRSTRGEGIIKLLLYFLRNMAMIAPPPNTIYDGDEAEVSRSATIDAFDYQDVFQLLLTLSSSMGEDFNTQDVIVMEILFYLVKGVNIERLFADQSKGDTGMMDEMVRLRKKEAAMNRSYQANASSRHNRFGSMAWFQRGDGRTTAISGQAAITDAAKSLAKMDSTKKFRPPRRAQKGETGTMEFDTSVHLNASATKNLRTFVEDFLDSGFNPLFNHIRKAIDREAERVLESHSRQFFYLVSWFLEAERFRRKMKRGGHLGNDESESFSLVASVLNQEMFVTLNRAMENTFESKMWPDLSAAMKCFTQILLTVQEMAESAIEDDQDIAENILNRIFYEETTHDRVASITRTYKDQGFGYLDSCTELAHNYLRILEQYSKQNVDMQVRSRRRVRRKKKAAQSTGEDDATNENFDDSDGEDEARAQKTSGERKFDFKRFASRFVTQGCVDTFVTFTKYYNDLKPEQLKRAHRYFYRVAFKQEMSIMLFRMDIIAMLHKMIKGPEGLDPQSGAFKEWDELVKQILRRCTKKIQERPELIVEMLFSKTNSTANYLEYGYDKQVSTTKPRGAAEMEVKPGMEWEEQVKVVVGALIDRNESDQLQWAKSQLSSAEATRRAWESANTALPSIEERTSETAQVADQSTETPLAVKERPTPAAIFIKSDTKELKTALFKNGYLRLLLSLLSFQLIGDRDDPDSIWQIPSHLSADQLKQSYDLIIAAEFDPPTFADGRTALDMIRRKSAGAARKKAAFDDGDDDLDSEDDGLLLFEPGGPTAMKKNDALKKLKKKRRVRDGSEDAEGPSEEILEARRKARLDREREKNSKIRSELYVHDSDDEDDIEKDRMFFEREEQLRKKTNVGIIKELLGAVKSKSATKGERKVKEPVMRKKVPMSGIVDDDSDDDVQDGQALSREKTIEISSAEEESDEDENEHSSSATNGRKRVANDISEDEAEENDTPATSPGSRQQQVKRRKMSEELIESAKQKVSAVVEDEDADAVAQPRQRVRGRAGIVLDSSDEE